MADDAEDVGKALKEKSMAEFAERTKGKPTPTQAENDAAAKGEAVVGGTHEADGSNPDVAAALPSGEELRAKAMAEFGERTKGRPTPTQEEVDKAAKLEAVVGGQHEADGSNPGEVKAMEAKPSGGYQTRASTAQRRVVASSPPSE